MHRIIMHITNTSHFQNLWRTLKNKSSTKQDWNKQAIEEPRQVVAAMCAFMNAHYPFDKPGGTLPTWFEAHAKRVHNTVSIHNGTNKFDLLTDVQALTELYERRLTGSFPLCSFNSTLHNTTPKLIETTDYFTSGYVGLRSIRDF